PCLQDLLVDRLQERLGPRLPLEGADVPLAHARRVLDQDLGESRDSRVSHDPAPGLPRRSRPRPAPPEAEPRRWPDDVTTAMKRAGRRLSSVSSAWKATARRRSSRTATGWPSISASTSTARP